MYNQFIHAIKVGALAMIAGATLAQAATVNVTPGMDLPTVVSANPAGTTFVFAPGQYRMTAPIYAKNGDVFTGSATCAPPTTSCTAILNGSRLLTTFEHSGGYYYAVNQTQENPTYITTTNCEAQYPGCFYSEDLFFDGVPLVHVTSLSKVTTGTWYFDYSTHTIYFSENPAGHTVETSLALAAFVSDGINDVTIKGLTIEKFAAPATLGAVGIQSNPSSTSGINWTITGNEFLLNHGDGIRINFGSQILNNYIHNNGNLGIGGGTGESTPSNILIQGNEVAYNNYAGVKDDYGAGGVKVNLTNGLTFRNNYVHDNLATGFHADTNNINLLVDGNTVTNNTEQGLFVELSYATIFRNNVASGNGYIYPNGTNWLYGAQIMSSNSENVQAYCNSLQVSAAGGNGLSIVAQVRAPGYISSNDYFHHNNVVFAGNSGWTGAGNSDSSETNFNSLNKFDYNMYHTPGEPRNMYAWNHAMSEFPALQADGQETHGTADTNYTATIPTVQITAPADEATVSGTTDVQGTVQDSTNTISKVELYVDSTLEATDASLAADGASQVTFSIPLSTSKIAAGSHVIMATAFDSDGINACYAVTLNVQ